MIAARIVDMLLETEGKLTLLDVYGGSLSNIDPDEGIFDHVGRMYFKVPLPVYTIPWRKLPGLKAHGGEMSVHQTYAAWGEDDPEHRAKVRSMSTAFRRKQILHPNDIIVIDGDVVIDGYHRVTAAFKAKHDLRAVNLQDLPD